MQPFKCCIFVLLTKCLKIYDLQHRELYTTLQKRNNKISLHQNKTVNTKQYLQFTKCPNFPQSSPKIVTDNKKFFSRIKGK